METVDEIVAAVGGNQRGRSRCNLTADEHAVGIECNGAAADSAADQELQGLGGAAVVKPGDIIVVVRPGVAYWLQVDARRRNHGQLTTMLELGQSLDKKPASRPVSLR